MQTSLPELPFPYIDPVYSRKHSAIRSTPRQYPHTDLQHLIPWESFHSDLHTAIEAACIARNIPTGTSLTVGTQLSRGRLVNDEEALRAHAGFVLHMAAEDVLAHLGVIGDFTSSVGSDAIVGAPDSSWVELGRPRLVVCVSAIPSSALNSV